ncbi:DUF397 domain-containing protein [Natronoglycomyces albus]|uniref:DUF397 domain-containing protein n=1 Tax=Natronoglycomyces albus TaxID=2811108 RepID=A0A895XYA7_9ACTN|nr:DUF397 domain-containing protein [Natronoglycomyces albus]QSB07170.1 DUF397 domain-containing protein [Natronoglycomyces albus]
MSDQDLTVQDFGDKHRWRKSRRSNDQGGACVFVAVTNNHVGVRDSKQGNDGHPLWISSGDFDALKKNLALA